MPDPVFIEIAIAHSICISEIERRFGSIDRRLGLRDQRVLQIDLRVEIANRGYGRIDVGVGLRERCAEITIIDPGEHLPRRHRLVVLHQHVGDVTGDLAGATVV